MRQRLADYLGHVCLAASSVCSLIAVAILMWADEQLTKTQGADDAWTQS